MTDKYFSNLLSESKTDEIANDIQKKYNLKYKPGLFIDKDNAISAASHRKGVHGAPWVALKGDNGYYWVVVLVDMEKLVKKGFKVVK